MTANKLERLGETHASYKGSQSFETAVHAVLQEECYLPSSAYKTSQMPVIDSCCCD